MSKWFLPAVCKLIRKSECQCNSSAANNQAAQIIRHEGQISNVGSATMSLAIDRRISAWHLHEFGWMTSAIIKDALQYLMNIVNTPAQVADNTVMKPAYYCSCTYTWKHTRQSKRLPACLLSSIYWYPRHFRWVFACSLKENGHLLDSFRQCCYLVADIRYHRTNTATFSEVEWHKKGSCNTIVQHVLHLSYGASQLARQLRLVGRWQ